MADNLEELLKELHVSSKPDAESLTKRRKFLFAGTHCHQTTGYSKVVYHIIQELAKYPSIEIYHFGFQKFVNPQADYRPYPAGVHVFDPMGEERAERAPKEMGFGFSIFQKYIDDVNPDVVLIYNDAGVVCRFLDKMKLEGRAYKLYVYLDQVYRIQRPEFLQHIEDGVDGYFAFTAFWKSALEAQGVKKPVHVLRHGFDPATYTQLDRATVRRKHGIPEHLMIFLNLNRNTPRKHHDIAIMAFVQLIARHPTKPLAYMAVCDSGESGGYPIQEIFLRELERARLPPQLHAQKLMITTSSLMFTDDLINEVYCLSDVGVSAADGEGFGLCHFESMGVGIPQVVPRIGGLVDFCHHGVNAMTVEPKYRSYFAISQSSVGGIAELVDPFDLSLAMEEYVMDSELRARHAAAARETVLSYKWSTEVEALANVILQS